MLWEVEIRAKENNAVRNRVCAEYDMLTHSKDGHTLLSDFTRGYLVEGNLLQEEQRVALAELLIDQVVEFVTLREIHEALQPHVLDRMVTVLRKPGVMDPVAQSVLETSRELGLPVESVRTFRRYMGANPFPPACKEVLFRKVLANEAI